MTIWTHGPRLNCSIQLVLGFTHPPDTSPQHQGKRGNSSPQSSQSQMERGCRGKSKNAGSANKSADKPLAASGRHFPSLGQSARTLGFGERTKALGLHIKNAVQSKSGRRDDVQGIAFQDQAALEAFASRAFFACAMMAENAAASLTARSERILRSASIPAAFRPSMKRE